MFNVPTISLAEARDVAEACLAKAQAEGAVIAVAVVDSAARPILLLCTDGVIPVAGEAALAKARTAVIMRRPTEALELARRDRPLGTSIFGVYEVEGGVPLFVGADTGLGGVCAGGFAIAGSPVEIPLILDAGIAAWAAALEKEGLYGTPGMDTH
ncbi:GlcG/HbpS family heme-binding protein [Sphingobium fluviale]|uniref:Heme-binding protein n=1 Tax=Sphingobium fluviale TaxID=2506423 RepID=A0A4Q1KGZ7_9SPHN|nr:heme-binding protein [Sphingobium fluviale]RXR28837.1 heme-binding protein [Sphingobium fluviale]